MRTKTHAYVLIGLLLFSACTPAATQAPVQTPAATQASAPGAPAVLRLATTTSTQDSGLLQVILPLFEKQYNARVDVVAVGTGQAIEIGTKGDADVLLVHARAQEDAFVAGGDGINRQDVMYNDFILVGPKDDSAGAAKAAKAAAAFKSIADGKAAFASRGDKSGTNTKEISLWSSAGITPTADNGWYFSLGQGMGETLTFANEKQAYTLTDRATWLAQKDKLPNLVVVFGGNSIKENPDSKLYNPYGVIAVNPVRHPGVNADLANKFIEWICSLDTQQVINDFGKDQFGQSLFYPTSAAWKAAHP